MPFQHIPSGKGKSMDNNIGISLLIFRREPACGQFSLGIFLQKGVAENAVFRPGVLLLGQRWILEILKLEGQGAGFKCGEL